MLDIRLMAAADVPATAALFEAMQVHYGVPCPTMPEIVSTLSRLPAGVGILVAADPAIVGFAAVCAMYPGPGLRPGLFLKELFVSSEARGTGVGTRLMRAAARLAVEGGYARLDWTADGGNAALLAFYANLGAAKQSEKVFHRLAGQALVALATSE